MRPVDQTTYGAHDGNCFSACVASILELPIAVVPPFVRYGKDWWSCFLRWLAARDLSATFYDIKRGDRAPPGFTIAGGPSKRFAGRNHSCVAFDGIVVHDPHPSRDGLPSGIISYVAIHGPRREIMRFSGVRCAASR